MCNLSEEIEARGEARGLIKGIVLALKGVGKTMSEVVEVCVSAAQISEAEAQAAVKALWNVL